MNLNSTRNYKTLIVERKEDTTTIRFNRPEKLNAISLQMIDELEEYLHILLDDYESQVVVFTGMGKAFSAGGDFEEMRRMIGPNDKTLREQQKISLKGCRILNLIEELDQITIAAINGYAFGAGLSISISCDFRIAKESAKFKVPEINLGQTFGWNSIPRLVNLVGSAKAKELIMLPRELSAAEAKNIGLVNFVVHDDDIQVETQALARRLSEKSPVVLKRMKAIINSIAGSRIGYLGYIDPDIYQLCIKSNDAAEGFKAFMEKRKPKFKGN